MGCNFYWKIPKVDTPLGFPIDMVIDRDDPGVHLGKSSAAGTYCWDCRRSLIKDLEQLHLSEGEWHKQCPECEKEHGLEDLSKSAAGLQLGFNKGPLEKQGVGTCCSFRWAQDPEKVKKVCKENPHEELVEDEYGRPFTGESFLEYLTKNCPIELSESIGQWFS